jgi:hypothetical protein
MAKDNYVKSLLEKHYSINILSIKSNTFSAVNIKASMYSIHEIWYL